MKPVDIERVSTCDHVWNDSPAVNPDTDCVNCGTYYSDLYPDAKREIVEVES